MTTNTPTPIEMPPNKIHEGIETSFATIRMLGSAHVINAPNKKANKITTHNLLCFEREEPMYSPTLLKPVDAPIWNKDKPRIKNTPPTIKRV